MGLTECTHTLHYRRQRHIKHQSTHSNKITPTHSSSPDPDAVNYVYREVWSHCFMSGKTFYLHAFLHHLLRWTVRWPTIIAFNIPSFSSLESNLASGCLGPQLVGYTFCTRQSPRISTHAVKTSARQVLPAVIPPDEKHDAFMVGFN